MLKLSKDEILQIEKSCNVDKYGALAIALHRLTGCYFETASEKKEVEYEDGLDSIELLPFNEESIRSIYSTEQINEEFIKEAIEFVKTWKIKRDLENSKRGFKTA